MKKQKITKNIRAKGNSMEILRKYFPHCFTKEGEFNIEKFKEELSNTDINFSKESYGMDWLGKSYARLLASDEVTTLLKEDKNWNKKNKDSQNLLIKGDNLEVLKYLSNAYYEKIKMIYIDPPYNTGSDGFVYQDDRKFTGEELTKLAGIDEEKAKRILDFVNSKSNSHSAWLTFMYPRLYIARQLLRDDGVIFVSIDDNEVAQLRLLMDEIFGEENFVGIAPRKTRGSATTKGDSDLQKLNDYLMIYFKNKGIGIFNKKNVGKKTYPYFDERGKYYIVPLQDNGPHGTREARPNLWYPIYLLKNGSLSYNKNDEVIKEYLPSKHQNKDGCWMWSKKKFDKDRKDLTIHNDKVYIKHYFNPSEDQNKYQREKLYLDDFLNTKGTLRLNKLFDVKGMFNNPKPVELLKWCINLSTQNNDIILDFFAGSGTTGDAVMQLNAEDGGNRKYILVQLPELIDEKKNKTAYDFVKNELKVENPTIFEITKERLIRAGKKIKEELINKKIKEKQDEIKKLKSQLNVDDNKEKIKQLEKEIENLKNQDLGFKIFETIPNNEGVWEDYKFEAEEFDTKLRLFDESKLTDEDIKTLLITWKTYDGIPLTEELKEIDLDGYKGYYYGTKLYLMNKGFKTENLRQLLNEIDENKDFNPATIIVFGYNFESKVLREIAENVKNYSNKKEIDIDFIIRY